MNAYWPIAVLLLALDLAGCTSVDQYVSRAEEAEADLQAVRSRKNALEQEVKSLRDLNDKLTANADALLTDLQELRVRRGAEPSGGTGTDTEPELKNLRQKVKDLTTRNRILQEQYEESISRNKTLKAAVIRYQHELKERQDIPSFTDLDLDRLNSGRKFKNPSTVSSASSN